MLDPFRDEIHRLLLEDARLPGKRLRELLEEQGYAGGKTILDDYPARGATALPAPAHLDGCASTHLRTPDRGLIGAGRVP